MSKYDSQGRLVLASDWNALQDIPAIVASLGGLTMSDGGILIGTGSDTLGVLAAGTDGDVLTIVSGAPAWQTAGSSIGDVYAAALGSDVPLSSSSANVGNILLPAAGTYYIEAFLSLVMGSVVPTFTTAYTISIGSASLPAPTAGYVRIINNLNSNQNYYYSILDGGTMGLYASDNCYIQGDGVIVVTSNTVLTLTLTLNSLATGTAKAPSLMRATRIA